MQAVYSVSHPPIVSGVIMQVRQAVDGGQLEHEAEQVPSAQTSKALYVVAEVPAQGRGF